MDTFFRFPYKSVPKDSKVIMYGGGEVGKQYLMQLQETGYCNVICVADKEWKDLQNELDAHLCAPDDIIQYIPEADFVIITVLKKAIHREMYNNLLNMGVDTELIIWCKPEVSGSKSYYGHFGEDVIVRNIFDVLGIRYPNYLNIGTAHPTHGSNTYYFYIRGSRGVNIEANPTYMEDIERILPEDININVGIGTQEGTTLPFYIFKDMLGVDSFCPDWAEKQKNQSESECATIDVEMTTINAIVKNYCNGKWPQYLNIDIEGGDYDALSVSDLTDGPLVIVTETQTSDMRIKMKEMLAEKGYVSYVRTRINSVFIRNDIQCNLE